MVNLINSKINFSLCKKKWITLGKVLVLTSLFACGEESPTSVYYPPKDAEPSDSTINPPAEIINGIQINTDDVKGEFYNFWSTRPMINQTRFANSSFRESIEPCKAYVKSYNLVRVLGGRTDSFNQIYKGVDNDGKIIADFTSLISDMKSFTLTGLKPRIVLDNVPWKMNAIREDNKYGNTNAPDDYDIWRQYINAFLQTMIDEFGYYEVKTWRFRVGTEPNYSPEHWNGTKDEYFKHYDITVDEVTKLIPEAKIGPGNLLTEGVATFTTELIDHCANGTNYATGEKGTQMDFLALSYYEKLDLKTVKFTEIIKPYREKLDSYAQFANIPFDIQEFGISRDENKANGMSLSDATELGASWYAHIADLAFENRISEIYDWGQESTNNITTGRRNVTEMFLKMENGSRLEAGDRPSEYSGIIPVKKDGKIYLFVYNHTTTRITTSADSITITPILNGDLVDAKTNWTVNEWTLDHDHGIYIHQMYEDIRAAGISNKTGASARIYGNKPDDYFEEGWEDVFYSNEEKYNELAKLPQTISKTMVKKADDGSITLTVKLAGHGIKLIELTPQ